MAEGRCGSCQSFATVTPLDWDPEAHAGIVPVDLYFVNAPRVPLERSPTSAGCARGAESTRAIGDANGEAPLGYGPELGNEITVEYDEEARTPLNGRRRAEAYAARTPLAGTNRISRRFFIAAAMRRSIVRE